MSFVSNIQGTLSPTFQIGLNGPTIRQGDTRPDNGSGAEGDLFILKSNPGDLLQKQNGIWVSLLPGSGVLRTTTPRGSSLSLDPSMKYVGVTSVQGSIPQPTTLTLPPGIEGTQIIIKDETGTAGTYPIILIPQYTFLIDGQNSATIYSNYGSVTVLYTNAQWWIIRRVT